MTRSIKLWAAALGVVGLVTYGLLVVGDFLLFMSVSRGGTEANAEARAIEDQRREEEDGPMEQAAIEAGFERAQILVGLVDQFYRTRQAALDADLSVLAIPKPNEELYLCNEGYGLVRFTSDRFGYRNDDAVWDSEAVDVVLIGDSFGQGACVPNEATITARLGAGRTALDLSTTSNEPIHYAAVTKVFVPELKPANAVMLFYANDNVPTSRWSSYYKIFFDRDFDSSSYVDRSSGRLEPSADLVKFNQNIMKILNQMSLEWRGQAEPPILERIMKRYYDARVFLRLTNIRWMLWNIFGGSETPPFTSRLALETLADQCAIHECRPIVAYIPNSEFWRPDSRGPVYAGQLRAYSEKLGLRFVDFSSELNREDYSLKGPHLSPVGYAKVAQGIEGALAPKE